MDMQIKILIDKYEIIIVKDKKIYFVDTETQEAMEIKVERILKLIMDEFKRI